MEKQVKLAKYLLNCYKRGVKGVVVKDSFVVVKLESNEILNYCRFLKVHSGICFEQLLDVWGVDYPGKEKRFEVNYLLLSVRFNVRVVVKIEVSEEDAVSSLGDLFNSASWLEREVWDMYGVYFENHRDLRRILTDYGFDGHPLRKDFPLTGFVEVRYDDGEKRVVTEPIEVTQEYRCFNFSSPWENEKK